MAHGWVTLVSPGHALGIVKYVDPQNPPNLLNQDLQFHKCARSSVCVCVHAHVCIPLLKYVRLLQLYGLQPTRFLCPWNFLGKSTEWVAFSYYGKSSQKSRGTLKYATLGYSVLGRQTKLQLVSISHKLFKEIPEERDLDLQVSRIWCGLPWWLTG